MLNIVSLYVSTNLSEAWQKAMFCDNKIIMLKVCGISLILNIKKIWFLLQKDPNFVQTPLWFSFKRGYLGLTL